MSKKSKKSNKNNNHKKNNQYNKYKNNKSQVNIKSNNQKKSIPNKPKKEFDLDKFISDTNIEPPVSTYKNYNNDSDFALEDNKKLDIERIFDESPNSIPRNKINKWKIISFILLILLIIVMFFAINLKNNSLKECNVTNKEEPKQEEIVEPKPQHEQYLFLGDSLFEQYNTYEFFRGYDTINTGISGITAEEMYDALDERLYQYNPTTIFILLGTNDLYKGYNADETFEHITTLVDKIHEDRPKLKINILSLLPINQTDDPKVKQSSNVNKSNEIINEINKNVEDYCKKNSFTYINVHDTLLDDEGNLKLAYTIEGLHLLDLGYHQMTMELLKYMQK